MSTTSRTVRLAAATVAASITALLLGGVMTIAQPQRDQLLAKAQQNDRSAMPTVAMAMSSTLVARVGR